MSQKLLLKQQSINIVKPPKLSFRPDIQGLRALAVAVVITDHLFGSPAGGFVGVDIFFVISGFIITGMMLREHEKTGRISLSDFYRRRVRRIMPVAVLVLLLTTLVSWFLFIGERATSVLWDALAASFFVANLRFAATGTDYMQADGPVSPLQHFWSLSVEEQFYLVWPVVFILVLGVLSGRLRWSNRVAKIWLAVVLLVLVAASLLFALWQTADTPTVAYFSTVSRAWEMGLGALAAVAVPILSRIPRAVQPIIQWTGLIGIFASLILITADTPFPAPGALLPVVSTMMVLAGGIGSQRFMFPLTNAVSRYVGNISYSLYLWHFPVIVFFEAAVPDLGLREYIFVLVTVLCLSIASYEFVESPIRHSHWLESKPSAGRNIQKRSFHLSLRKQILGLSLLAMAATGVVGAAVEKTSPAERSLSSTVAVPSVPEPSAEPTSPEGLLEKQISSAATASSWPTLTPSLDTLGSVGFEKADSEGCAPATPRGKSCDFEGVDSDKLVFIVGDSMGAAWAPSVRAALEPQGWTVETLTYVGCPFLDADTVAADDSITNSCADHKQLVRSIIDEIRPKLVVVSNLYNLNLSDGSKGEDALSTWESAAATARGEWLAGAERVVTLAAPPAGSDPKACITRLSDPVDCTSPITSTWLAYAAVDERVSRKTDDLYLDERSWFCTAARLCPVFADGTIIRRDSTHITEEYAVKLAPLMAEALAPALE